MLEVPGANSEKILPPLKKKLKEITGVVFEGYCDSRKLLFLRIDHEAFNNVLDALRDANLIYYIKENTPISAAKNECSSQKEIELSLSND